MNSAIHVRKLNLKFQSNLASIVVSVYTQFVMICTGQNLGLNFGREKAKFIQNIISQSIFHLVLCVIRRKGEMEKMWRKKSFLVEHKTGAF
jgi:hypothetical protein